MSLKPTLTITVCRGEQKSIPYEVTKEDGSPFSLAGLRLFFMAKASPTDAALIMPIKISTDPLEIEITDDVGGKFTLHLLTGDTDIDASLNSYSIAYDDGAGLDRTVMVKNQQLVIEQSTIDWPA